MISIAKPYIGAEENAAVNEVLTSGQLASGPRVHEFERAFATYCHSARAEACSNGTAALCVSMMSLGLPHGSKVLTTPFSFIATANAILYAECIPVFIDIDPQTFNLSAAAVRAAFEADPDIRAVIPVHLYGQAVEIKEITEIAHSYGAIVIEDAAQAHGAEENGVPVGAIGDLGIFSFYPTKNMMTGEGGIITGSNDELLEKCRLIIDQGAAVRYCHTTLGFNYRMTSIAAAIGLVQLQRLPAWNDLRRRNAKMLSEGLADLTWLTIPYERPGCTHVFHQYVLKVPERDRLQQHLLEHGVGSAVHYPRTITDQPLYHEMGFSSESTPIAREMAQKVLSLPVHPALSEEDVQAVIAAVRSFVPAG